MKNKGAKQKLKRKGAASAFGCDLTEYLESSGQDVPYVLKSCAEFIETHGIVDGIYRLSGVTSNIQRLRQEFGSDQCPDLTREVYLQDIHCVGSLCKLYFRELPNPLLTYELYEKFTEAVSHCPEEGQLARIQNVIQELPPSHYRTLEYLIRHLAHIASFSSKTNMHARNLALVWAPNLLRSKEIEATGCNGDAAFLAVRVQQVVIEFILNHVDQIFNNGTPGSLENNENPPIMKSLTLPALSLPMKLVSLEEAQARSLATNHPARKERRENSLPEIVPPSMGTLFHTVLELPDNKRKLSSKSKKWKSIFNLGRSGSDSKSKLSRNGSVFVRGQRLSVEKATIRPAKSMDSLCSVPVEGKETKGNFNRTVTTGGFFIPAAKLHSTSPGSSCDLSKQEGEWGQEGMPAGAEGGFDVSSDRSQLESAQARPPPEQLKVFRPIEDPESEQTAPKMLGMFYTSNDSPSKSVFTSSLFQMEPSPRHQRKALNISEPFAVSVPLRVSAVISTNSTPCRTPPKELQSLSSLEEFSFQGSESGGWPEDDKPLGAETSTASVPKKAALEDAKPGPEAVRTEECSKGLSLEPGSQLEEKKAPEISLGSQHPSELEKRLDPEKVVEEGREADQGKPSTLQESPRARAEAVFLHEMDEDDVANTLIWPEIQQELKIIESEEELSLPPPAPKICPVQPNLEPSPGPLASPEPPESLSCGPTAVSTPVEEWTRDPTNQSTQGTSTAANREKPETMNSLHRSEPEKGQRPDPTSLAPLEIAPFEAASSQARVDQGGPGNLSPLLPPAAPPPTPLEEAPRDQLSKGSPEREDSSRNLQTNPYIDQLKSKGSPGTPRLCQGEEVSLGESEHQNSENAAPEGKGSGLQSPTREVEISPQGEGDVAHSVQEPSDCDEDETVTDIAQHGLEMVEPWEEPQWVTSPLHSPTLKDVQEAQVQGAQGHRLEKRLPHRPSLRQSHSLDSKTTSVKSQWTLETPSSSSCANLEAERNSDPLQSLASRREITERDEKTLRSFREFSGPKGTEAVPSQKGPSGLQPEPAEISPVSLAEGKELGAHQGHNNPQIEQGSVPGPDNSKESSPSVQDSTLPGEHPPKLQLRGTDCGPPKGKHRPSSLNLDSAIPITDLFRFENVASFGSPGMQLSDPGDRKVTWMSSSHCKVDPWSIYSQDPQDLDIVAQALTGRRNSAPVSVSAVRTSFMVKMCQARAVPVIPPKIQYTQIPQPLPSQSSGDSGAQPLERGQEEPSSTGETNQKSAKDDSVSSSESPKEEKSKQDTETTASLPMDTTTSHLCEGPTLPPEPVLANLLSTQDATVQCRKRTSETEPSGDNLLSSKIERPSGGSKPFHRSRPGRPQSLILFSPPFPIMDHPPPSSAVTDSKVLLSPIRSPTQTVSPGLLCGDLAENTWVTPEGVTLRNKMTIPKNGQRLETSTSCFYQPQRRSVILDGRNGRQIE
ncbi:rho GTPase-activating protein 31 [Panthera onca]